MRVHPRSRGASRKNPRGAGPREGPSPLARGILSAFRLGSSRPGSIPARAGHPVHAAFNTSSLRVHPRSRGASVRRLESHPESPGPSPLARGIHIDELAAATLLGSIPARAGHPTPSVVPAPRIRVHPRSRGASRALSRSANSAEGPSPLARGIPSRAAEMPFSRGSIPARAGHPAGQPLGAWPKRVHPRSRGASEGMPVGNWYFQGPSPLARGIPALAAQVDALEGSIPARAGHPLGFAPAKLVQWVHPRSRGASPPALRLRGVV